MMLRIRQFARACSGRCPLCGRRWPRHGLVVLAPQCPTCQVRLDRGESDFFLGAYTINLFATLMITVLLVIAAIASRLPLGVWMTGIVAVLASAFAAGFYPISKLLWLAIDVQFRNPIERDFDPDQDSGW